MKSERLRQIAMMKLGVRPSEMPLDDMLVSTPGFFNNKNAVNAENGIADVYVKGPLSGRVCGIWAVDRDKSNVSDARHFDVDGAVIRSFDHKLDLTLS